MTNRPKGYLLTRKVSNNNSTFRNEMNNLLKLAKKERQSCRSTLIKSFLVFEVWDITIAIINVALELSTKFQLLITSRHVNYSLKVCTFVLFLAFSIKCSDKSSKFISFI